jgi:hypothetical protein
MRAESMSGAEKLVDVARRHGCIGRARQTAPWIGACFPASGSSPSVVQWEPASD